MAAGGLAFVLKSFTGSLRAILRILAAHQLKETARRQGTTADRRKSRQGAEEDAGQDDAYNGWSDADDDPYQPDPRDLGAIGLEFSALLRAARDELLVTTEVQLRAFLGELKVCGSDFYGAGWGWRAPGRECSAPPERSFPIHPQHIRQLELGGRGVLL